MTGGTEIIHLVWKIPEESFPDEYFSDVGVYPTGELMGIHWTEGDAETHIMHLREHSPSERFGESMDDAPYQFVISQREVDI